MSIFFTSDQHFGHANILKYCPNRKFLSVEDHDEHLIKMWNSLVTSKDTVFSLGDFAFGTIEYACSILKQLNGKKVLIAGNHDVRFKTKPMFKECWNAVINGYHEVEVKYLGQTTLLVLCHYPLESFNKMRYGSFHLHGHSHTPYGELRLKHLNNRKDVGVDSRLDHAPWEKNDLLETISNEQKT